MTTPNIPNLSTIIALFVEARQHIVRHADEVKHNVRELTAEVRASLAFAQSQHEAGDMHNDAIAQNAADQLMGLARQVESLDITVRDEIRQLDDFLRRFLPAGPN